MTGDKKAIYAQLPIIETQQQLTRAGWLAGWLAGWPTGSLPTYVLVMSQPVRDTDADTAVVVVVVVVRSSFGEK